MKIWLRRILIVAIVIGLTAAGLYENATHEGRGWLRGEAFFDGRPTSYWRSVILEDLHFDPRRFVDPIIVPPTWSGELRVWIGWEPRWDISLWLINDANAVPVLKELMGDSDERVSLFARELWNVHRLEPAAGNRRVDGTMRSDLLQWQKLICKHNIKHKGLEHLLD